MVLPSGVVAGDFRPLGPRGRGGTASYELLVSNDTAGPLASFAYAIEAPGPTNRITWNAIVVPPYSGIAVTIDIPIPRRGRMPRVVAELHSEDAHLTLDADHHRHSTGTIVRRAVLAAAAVLAIGFGGSSVAQSQPRVLALAAPESVRNGTPFSVAYAMGHADRADYSVETPDGLQVRRGKLDPKAGAFTVALPATPLSSGYDLSVTARGPFGTSTRTTHVVALPAILPGPVAGTRLHNARVRISAVALERDIVHGGEPIVVDYRASARTGSVRLIDQLGTVRAEALFGPSGRSIIVAPYVDADQDLRVVVNAQRGTASDEAELPVRVLHADGGTFAGAPPPPAAAAPAVAPVVVAADQSDGPISVAKNQVIGEPIVVRVLRHEPDLHVAVMGPSGDELTSADVGPDQSSIILPGVSGQGTARVSLVATFARGFGQETVVRPLALHARETRS